jgi:transposase
MAEKILMGQKELARTSAMEKVKEGNMTLAEAAAGLRVSYRQAKRIWKAYREKGAFGLVHGNRGRASNNRTAEKTKTPALAAYREKYPDFGPAFAAEKLKENGGIAVSGETPRQWLIAAGLWARKRKSRPYRSRRERRPRFGDLVQFDGSHHGRFEGRGRKCCLMNMAGGAAGKTLSMLFEEETAAAAMTLLSCRIKKYGIPRALYRDRKNAYVTNRGPAVGEQLAGETPRSRFEKACGKLNTRIITASSPQAKGRAERNRAVCQDRFVKELGLAGIPATEEANKFLSKTHIPKTCAKFARPPAGPRDAHVPLGKLDLREILCFEYRRPASRDYAVSFERRLFQILKDSRPLPRPGDKVAARVRLDSSLDIYFRDKKLSVKEIKPRERKEAA